MKKKVRFQKPKTELRRGKFIVLYGANNLGKTTQAKLLVASLKKKKIKAYYLKYPIYDLSPTGPIINSVLRGKLDMPEKDLQKLFFENRADYEGTLDSLLNKGGWVVAEDYTGTGIAWGMVGGLSRSFLEKLNKKLLKEDLAILLSGKRFIGGREENNIHERNEVIWKEAFNTHLRLAKKYKWRIISSNGTKKAVLKRILREVNKVI